MSEFITFLTGDYKLLQDDDGYLFSADSVLLANLSKIGAGDSVIDLGTGSGVLAILLAVKKGAARVVGVELDGKTAEMARKSVKLNKLEDRIAILDGDVRNISALVTAGAFDKAICNPPYYSPEDGTTKSGAKAVARKNVEGTLDDFVKAAAYSLKNGGDFYLVYKFDRVADAFCSLRAAGLEPKTVTLVYPKLSKGVDTAIISARKGGKCGLVSDTLILMDEDGRYTPRVKEIYD